MRMGTDIGDMHSKSSSASQSSLMEFGRVITNFCIGINSSAAHSGSAELSSHSRR